MSRETRRRHTREFVETLIGPAVYVVYFVLAYSASAVACTLSQGTTPTIPDGAATVHNVNFWLTLIALVVITGVVVLALRRLAPTARATENDQDFFLAILTLALALLSALAVMWTGIATLLVPACA